MLLNFVKSVPSSSILQRLNYVAHCGAFRCLGSSLGTRCQQISHQSNRSLRIINKRNYSVEVRTDVANNVLLWRYDTSNYHRYLTIFSVVQCIVFTAIAYYAITFLPSWEENETLIQYSKRSWLTIGIVFFAITTGVGAMWISFLYTKRSVKYIILHKGGKDVTLVTFHPFKGTTQKTVPIDHIQTTKYRAEKRMYMPLRVKNTSLYHLLDADGVFVNPELFDHTVGLNRLMMRSK